jgi:serine/threonine protein kinase
MRRAAGFATAEAQFTISAETRQSLAKNKVTLGEPLGKPGAYGAVFAATDELRRKLAVKIVKNPNDRTVRKRHQRECQVLGSSQIPADLIPTLFFLHKAKVPGDLGRPDASGDSSDTSDMADNVAPYIVMSRISGKEIHEYVGGDRPLSMSERIDLVEKMFEALGRLHDAGIAHGDLSPRNVLVEFGNRIRFVDFGNSKDIGKALLSLNSTCTGGGTENFAPTAQLTGEAPVSAANDIRALSAVAYVALTGQFHNQEMTPQEKHDALRVAGVPAGIASILLKGLIEPDPKKNRDSRVFASATEVVEAIAAWRRSQARRRQLTLMAPIFAVMFLLLGGAGWKLLADAHERRWQTLHDLGRHVAANPLAGGRPGARCPQFRLAL